MPDPAIAEEAGERRPAAQHVVGGLGEVVVARKLPELLGQPGMEIVHQRRAVLASGGKPLVGAAAGDGPLDVEQSVETPHGLERDRVDRLWSLAPRFPACGALDIGELEELAPGMGEAAGLEHPAGRIELAIAAIGVGLEDAMPGCEMGLRMLTAPIARVMEQGGGRRWPGERPVVADIGP
jgi:hypothetical protein